MYRAQQRAVRRRSLLGPLLLVFVGLVLLALQTGHFQLTSLLAWLGHWWPLVLLGAGVVLLTEWAWDTATGKNSAVADLPRRRLGPGSAFLIFLLVLAGLLGHGLERVNGWSHEGNGLLANSSWLERIFAQHAEQVQSLSAPLAPGATLTIQNYAGNISINGDSQDGQVHVTVRQHLTAWQNSELQDRERRDRPSLQSDDSGLLLRIAGEGRDRTDLQIEMPHEAALALGAEQGDLSVSELRGSVRVVAHQGDVELTALTGPVTVTSDDDNADITGHSLAGNIQVSGRAGDLTFSDVTGSLTLQGDFFGETHLDRIQAPVRFDSSFTHLACAAIPGHLHIDGRSDLTAGDLVGPVTLATSNRKIDLDNLRGAARIDNRDGPVHLSFAGPLGQITVSTTQAPIALQIPRDAAFKIRGTTTDGAVDTDFSLPVQNKDGKSIVMGQVKVGGPSIELTTTQGRISVLDHKADLSSQEAKDGKDDDNEN